MEENQLSSLHITLGEYIRNQFGLWTGNKGLMESCRFVSKKYDIHYDLGEGDASALIIRELWRELRETHSLRVVKDNLLGIMHEKDSLRPCLCTPDNLSSNFPKPLDLNPTRGGSQFVNSFPAANLTRSSRLLLET